MQNLIAHPNGAFRLGDFLTQNLQSSKWTSFRAAVAFAKVSGTRYIVSDLKTFAQKRSVSFTVGIDHDGTSFEAVSQLLDAVTPSGQLWVYKNPANTFHPKVFLFKNESEADIVIGSGNLTKGGLYENTELGIRLQLDLDVKKDAAFLGELESQLDCWSSYQTGTCLLIDSALINALRTSGELPTEVEAAAAIKAARAAAGLGKTVPVRGSSLFLSQRLQPAPTPPILTPPAAGVILSSTVTPTPATVTSANTRTPISLQNPGPHVSVASSVPRVSGNPATTFGMTLQKTDVGVGQTTQGTGRRSPEIFIPLAALDTYPEFWGWFDSGNAGPQYQVDPQWPAIQSIPNRIRPVQKLDWANVRVNLKNHIDLISVSIWFNPQKVDIRIRASDLRAAGKIGDILLVRPAQANAAYDYDMEVISQQDPNFSSYLANLTNKVPGASQKLFGYF